jgi:hypothetical protein
MTENQPAEQPPESNPTIPAPGTSENFPAYPEGEHPSGPGGIEVPDLGDGNGPVPEPKDPQEREAREVQTPPSSTRTARTPPRQATAHALQRHQDGPDTPRKSPLVEDRSASAVQPVPLSM